MIKSVSYVTDQGLVCDDNQDSIMVKNQKNFGIFVVADGMGGHSAGGEASSYLVKRISQWWDTINYRSNYTIERYLIECKEVIQSANTDIYEGLAKKNMRGGTTVVTVIISNHEYVVLWAGDSRVYMAEDKIISVLTNDDVWENNPQNVHGMSHEEIDKDKRRGKLTNAVGATSSVDVHTETGRLKKRNRFLLCSDGMYKFCQEKKIKKYMINKSVLISSDSIIKKWIKDINKNGAKDNYSIILFETFEDRKEGNDE